MAKAIETFFLFKARNTATKEFSAIGGSARKSASEMKKLDKAHREMGASAVIAAKHLRAFAGVLGTGVGFAALTSALDTAITMENQLRLVTNSQQELNRVFGELRDISQETRTPLDANVEAFRRLGVATKSIGTSTAELLALQKSLNHALIISGSGAQEARAGLIQFGQGLASGKLQGDELRSVLENIPRLGQAIATGLGIPYGKLRDELSKGKITTEQLIKSIASQAGVLEDEFNRTTSTIGQGFERMRTAALAFVFEFNRTTGVAQTVAGALSTLAFALDKLADNAGRITFVFGTLAVLAIPKFVSAVIRAYVITQFTASVGLAAKGLDLYKLAIIGATVQTRAFTVALLANPFTPIIAGAALAIAGLIAFNKQIKGIGDVIDSLRVLFERFKFDVGQVLLAIRLMFTETANHIKTVWSDVPVVGKFIDKEKVISDHQEALTKIVQDHEAMVAKYNSSVNNILGFEDIFKGIPDPPPGGGDELDEGIKKRLEALIEERKKLEQNTEAQRLVIEGQFKSIELAKLDVEFRKTANTEIRKTIREVQALTAEYENNAKIIALDEQLSNLEDQNTALQMVLSGQSQSLELAKLELEIQKAITPEIQARTQKVLDQTVANQALEEQLNRQKKLAESLRDTFKDTFKDLISGAKSFGDAISALEDKLMDLLLNAALEGIAGDLGFGGNQKGGDIFSELASVFTGSFKEGGISTEPVQKTTVPLSVFKNAPQFANGGLSSGFPAILHPQEAVVPLSRGRKIPVDLGTGGGGTTIIMNITTPDADSFRKSQSQILQEAQTAASRAARRNG